MAQTGQTLVFYMGVGQLAWIAWQLMRHGRASDTPFALVENGSLPSQRAVYGTLETLVRQAREHAIRSPALLLVGEVAALGPKLNWFGTSLANANPVNAELAYVE
jgi:uroporphyrin-III C-methyltransferase/precorrin-2 dehydrogenase/sirohydrochlorin ferrochelatase